VPVAVAVSTRLWLLGHGVARSPSPAMQNAALRACGLDWEYSIRDVAADALPGVIGELRDGAAAGCNVTIPHKRAVAAACDVLDGDAEVTRAVNTVVRTADGLLVGHNTDARGLEAALRHEGLWPAPGAIAVVLGAGGAAAAAVLAVLRAQPARVHVAARRPEAARALAPVLHVDPLDFDAGAVTLALSGAPYSVLVNATPAPLHDLPVDLGSLPLGCTVVDLRYRYEADDLVPAARARGLRAADGLEMLLQQGMLSFELWTGRPAPVDAARSALHAAVGRA